MVFFTVVDINHQGRSTRPIEDNYFFWKSSVGKLKRKHKSYEIIKDNDLRGSQIRRILFQPRTTLNSRSSYMKETLKKNKIFKKSYFIKWTLSYSKHVSRIF